MFLRSLVIVFGISFYCCTREQHCDQIVHISIGNKNLTCDHDFPIYSINDLENVISSCHEVHFCSSQSQFQVTRRLSFVGMDTISFIGGNHTTLYCTPNAGIEFSNVTNLNLKQLQFLNCARQYQLNYNIYWIGIMVFNCSTTVFENVIFNRSKGIGVAVIATAGTNKFYKSSFVSLNGSGMMLEVSQYNDTYWNIQDSVYVIEGCKFIGNFAHSGGGMHISFKNSSRNNTIQIISCYFLNNEAQSHGGGLHFYFLDKTYSNVLVLSHSIFKNNTSHRKGGAYSMMFLSYIESNQQCRNNSVIVNSCLFEGNCAKFGGGLYFSSTPIYKHLHHTSYNRLKHCNCTWRNNLAQYGAAIITVPTQWRNPTAGSLLVTVFENVTLQMNRVHEHFFYESKHSLQAPFRQNTLGGGALYCSKRNLVFKGTLVVEYNNGSGVLSNSCSFIFLKGLSATFTGNIGYAGGALQLIGYSALYVSRHSTFRFYNNTAQTDGGAIDHQTSDIVEHDWSDACFISGTIDSTVKFDFVGNLAGMGDGERGHGNSIHVSSLQSCSMSSFKQIANISKKNEVVTRVSSFSAQQSNRQNNLLIVPGKFTQLDFKGYDDLEHERSALYKVTVLNHNKSEVIPHALSSFATNNSIKLLGNPGDIATVYLSTLSKQKTVLSFTVELEPCPPGYVLQQLDGHSKGCVCSSDTDMPYTGIDCDFLNFSARRIQGFWAGYDENVSIKNDSSFITAYCPRGYCQYSTYQLPEHASREILNSIVCSKNREGLLCSRCKKNTSHYFHSSSNLCGGQDLCRFGFLFYIASEIIPVTVIFLIIIATNISFTAGSVNGFIFYAQVIVFFQIEIFSRIDLQSRTSSMLQVIVMLYETLNLDFFYADTFAFCLFENANPLDLRMFKYVTVFYSFFLILFIILGFRKCHFWPGRCFCKCRFYSIQTSMIHGLTAFFILCFAKCVRVSTSMLSFNFVWGRGEQIIKTVVYRYGEYGWFSPVHMKYVITSLAIGFVMVIMPLFVLLFYPIGFKCLSIFKIREKKLTLILCKPIEKIVPFLDSFQGCFRDKCRFFSGLYFIYRIAILLNYSLNSTSYFYFILEIQILIMLLIHALVQPYKKRSHNAIDSLLFTNMALINGISMFNYTQTFPLQGFFRSQHISFIIQEILMMLPLICIMMYLIYRFIRVAPIKCMKMIFKMETRDQYNEENSDLMDYCELQSSRSEIIAKKAMWYDTFRKH